MNEPILFHIQCVVTLITKIVFIVLPFHGGSKSDTFLMLSWRVVRKMHPFSVNPCTMMFMKWPRKTPPFSMKPRTSMRNQGVQLYH